MTNVASSRYLKNYNSNRMTKYTVEFKNIKSECKVEKVKSVERGLLWLEEGLL